MDFTGTGKRLTDLDLPRIGHEIGVGEDEIHAILEVECRGRGFDSKNRPVILFEPHIFYKYVDGVAKAQAVELGLARRSWKRDYPSDSYPRLEKAMALNAEGALKSCSWGLGQIMGFNHKLAGHPTVFDMVEAFKRSEADQLQGMVNYIKNTGLDAALRRHDWAAFAKGYNGPGYAVHGYHTRLAAAYRKWQAFPDTNWKREVAVSTARRSNGDEHVSAVTPPRGLWSVLIEILENLRGSSK